MKRIVLTLVAVCFLTAFFNPTNSVASPAPLPDGGVSVQFDPNTYTVDEGAGTVTLTVRRTGDTSVMTVVGFNTLDGTAMAESDYTPVGGTLTFEPGETTQTIIVPIVNDTMLESNETFTANIFPEDIGDRIRNGLDGTAPLSTATVTIVDNDGAPTPSPTPANVQLGNISGRALVQTDEKVGICGFIISGGTGKRIIVRGIGPSLRNGSPPIAAALNDPMIELYNANAQVIGSNDSWRSAQQGEIQTSGLAPSDDREAAIIATLQPGAYTAIVRGAGNSSGVALVEVYELQS
ncbi:MAG TPA: Calx-beta domain-containing protein, partial [Chthoniobacterales bacterium]|nr:Calx-beta domain-containing protein [Chthoniobacterales bacterium]